MDPQLTPRPVVAAIVVAAGRGERANPDRTAEPKQYRPIAGVPMLARTLGGLLANANIAAVLPVIHADDVPRYRALGLVGPTLLAPALGGPTRQLSVLAGLRALKELAPDYVLIQDAARPFVSASLIEAVIAALATQAGALPVTPLTDTIKRSEDGQTVSQTEDRHKLFCAQTPQGFRFVEILAAHERAALVDRTFTDDASIAEWAGLVVALTPGAAGNIKITRPEDFARAERLLMGDEQMETRIGSGYDVHPFTPGTFVKLCGVEIPHTHGLEGHSDADAGLHALTDALYGALGEGDIGQHFPPGDPQWKGADSALFLRHAAAMVAARSGRIVNLDLTLICEAPRIGPHVAAMRARIAEICAITATRIAVKATTSEKLGFTGRREGIMAMASASIELPRRD